VARAKRTSRAAARRRHRAEIAAGAEGDASVTASGSASGAAGTRSSAERPSFGEAFRTAYRPPRLGDDLRQLPILLLSRAFLIPAGLVVAAGILLLTPLMTDSLVAIFVGAMVFVPPAYAPPLIAPFLAGFLATRASYLIGGLIGLIVVLMFAVYVFVTPASSMDATDRVVAILQAASLEIPTAVLFAAFAAYYKRLLRVWSPANAQRDRRRR
jgi:hypothetical protein